MTMSPLYPCGKPCSRGTHHETVKTWPYFLYPMGVFSILQSNRKFYHIYTLTIVIRKSRSLIGTEEIDQFGPK